MSKARKSVEDHDDIHPNRQPWCCTTPPPRSPAHHACHGCGRVDASACRDKSAVDTRRTALDMQETPEKGGGGAREWGWPDAQLVLPIPCTKTWKKAKSRWLRTGGKKWGVCKDSPEKRGEVCLEGDGDKDQPQNDRVEVLSIILRPSHPGSSDFTVPMAGPDAWQTA